VVSVIVVIIHEQRELLFQFPRKVIVLELDDNLRRPMPDAASSEAVLFFLHFILREIGEIGNEMSRI
jgi:hypothetical protein